MKEKDKEIALSKSIKLRENYNSKSILLTFLQESKKGYFRHDNQRVIADVRKQI